MALFRAFVSGLLPLFAGAFFAPSAAALVDTRSAGYTQVREHFKAPGPGFELKIEAAYNSRSLYNGILGYGWCSNLETRLDALPGNVIRGVECGGGMEILYHTKGQAKALAPARQTESIIQETLKRRKMSQKTIASLRADLMKSQTLRSDFLTALGLKAKVVQGMKYYANGRVNEYVESKSGKFVRHLPNGVSEVFASDGSLAKIYDKFGAFIDIKRSRKKIEVTDNKGRRLVLLLDPITGKVKEARFKGQTVAKYQQDSREDLRMVELFPLQSGKKRPRKRTFKYRYDSLHNLLSTEYPDGTAEQLTYDAKRDWVTSFKDRKGCRESYKWRKNAHNPNHYSSEVKKICGGKVVTNGKYEFWNKKRPKRGGEMYLHRARSKINGRITDVFYHPDFGTPVSFLKNGVRTKRAYYANGFLKMKSNPYREVTYKNYIKKCRKPNLVRVKTKDPSQNGKVVKVENVRLEFRDNCYLSRVVKSRDEWIRVTPDDKGRLIGMEDQSRKKVKIAWNDRLNKPEIITRPGVGSIKLIYRRGVVVNVVGKSGPTVVAQVSSVFNSFLSSLAPVAEEMALL